ncbi:MAG: Mitochondrial import inner membrane translocase subunit tim8 [Peltula sp. TS41687]|nr:MAG: Mitochondrial import inner membrane translocase subunit tim8 [Peltula sp. TS41687]
MDISSLDPADVAQLSDRDRAELSQFLANEHQKARIHVVVHDLTAMCFKKCITTNIRSGKLDNKTEEPCLQNCLDRFMDANFVVLKHLEALRGGNPGGSGSGSGNGNGGFLS